VVRRAYLLVVRVSGRGFGLWIPFPLWAIDDFVASAVQVARMALWMSPRLRERVCVSVPRGGFEIDIASAARILEEAWKSLARAGQYDLVDISEPREMSVRVQFW
jgi:hypothetical protein